MIDLHYWPTPNGWKISICLEEMGVPYTLVPVNITTGEQFTTDFQAISPNGRMPAIVDRDPIGGGAPISVFESGAILMYLGEKYGQFYPTDLRARTRVNEWLMWQMGGLGPMSGQNTHFRKYAPEEVPYAIDRYTRETARLFGVLDARLATHAHVAGTYSIADMAILGWVRIYKTLTMNLPDFPHVKRWYDELMARPGVTRGFALGKELVRDELDAQAKQILFGLSPQK